MSCKAPETTRKDQANGYAAIRSLNTYNANGKVNKVWGPGQVDPTDKTTFSSIFDNNIQTAGYITLPVCSGKEALDNWTKGQKSSGAKFYPCS